MMEEEEDKDYEDGDYDDKQSKQEHKILDQNAPKSTQSTVNPNCLKRKAIAKITCREPRLKLRISRGSYTLALCNFQGAKNSKYGLIAFG